jgi:hypothetical protein
VTGIELVWVLVLVKVGDVGDETEDEVLDDELDIEGVLDDGEGVLEVKGVELGPRLAPGVVTLGKAENGVNATPVNTICKCTSDGCPAKVVSTVVAQLEAPQPY